MAVTNVRNSIGNTMDLRGYLALFNRRRWIIVLGAVLVGGMALGASSVQSPVYEAKSRLFLEPSTSVFDAGTQQLSPARVQTEIQVLQSRPVRDAVRERLGEAPPASATQVGPTEVIEVSVKGTDPRRAAQLTDAYVTAYLDYRRKQAVADLVAKSAEIQRVLDTLKAEVAELDRQAEAAAPSPDRATTPRSTSERDALISQQALFKQKLDQLDVDRSLRSGNAQVVAPAEVPTEPVSPRPVRNSLVGIGLGLVMGLAVALVVEHLDDSIKTKEDLEHAGPGLAVVGMIPFVATWRNRAETRVISQTEPNSPAAEAYRSMRTSINFLGVDRTMRVVQITSPNSSEGKTATTANLAVALARAGEQVVVVNCDLRRPRIHSFFGLQPAIGFTNVLLGELPLAEALQPVPGERNLRLLAAGKLPPNPSELLSSPRTKQLLDALKAQGVMVLIDCPPILPVTDAAVLSSRVDATILVALADSTTGKDVARALELLGQVSAPLIGTVLNGVPNEGGYSYQYGYSTNGSKQKPAKRRKVSSNGAAPRPATNGRSPSPAPAIRPRAVDPPKAPAKPIESSKGSSEDPGTGSSV